jgi:arylsulfatase A-like enzyme
VARPGRSGILGRQADDSNRRDRVPYPKRHPIVTLAMAVAVLGSGIAVAMTRAPGARAQSPALRPNIVYIVTDDQSAEMVSVMPNVRRLIARKGMTFTNAFATTPLCCPARASLLTGQFSSTHGVIDNAPPLGGAPAFDDASTVATWLHDAGYSTALIGKYLNAYQLMPPSHVPPGWDEWHALRGAKYYEYSMNVNGVEQRFGSTPAHYLQNQLTARALTFIRKQTGPFFLHFSPYAPHLEAVPAPSDEGKFENEPGWRPPAYNEDDVTDKPLMARAGSKFVKMPAPRIWALDQHRKRALESLLSVDRAVGKIVALLERLGQIDDTLIVFTSDNGFLWGQHRVYGKVWPYEESIKVPLMIRGPGVRVGVEDRLVANIDLAPTFTELAGTQPGLPQDGRSLVPLLRRDPAVEWREDLFIEYLGSLTYKEVPTRYRGLRTERWKLIAYQDAGLELYDLEADPYELDNIAGTGAVSLIEQVLLARLERYPNGLETTRTGG